MKAKMKIPFEQKESLKKIAKDNHCALWFSKELNCWEFAGKTIPKEFNIFIIPGTLKKDDEDFNEEKKIITKVTSKKIQDTVKPYNYVIDLPFMLRDKLSEIGGYYDKENKVTLVKNNKSINQIKKFMSQPYSYEAWIEKKLNNGVVREDILNSYSKENQIIPRDYQKVAHKLILEAYKKGLCGFLLADEVGLGKTISAALAAQDKDFESILVVTTLAAVPHWRKTFLKFNFLGKEIIIINYDRLQKLFTYKDSSYKSKAKTKRAKNKRLAKNGEAPEFDLIIFDESHKLRNNTTMRSKLSMKLAENSEFVLYLSATAGQNPLELSYLAPLLAELTGQSVKNMSDFEGWCKKMNLGVSRGEFGKWIWDGSQESIDKVHSLLFKSKITAALRRVPSDIVGYPEISRALTPFELSADELQSYQMAWEEFKAFMNSEAAKKKAIKGSKDNVLVAKLRLRQKASLLKIPYTLEQVEDLLENGHQIAISVAFKETLRELEEKIKKLGVGVSLIFGEQNAEEKEHQRLMFQKGENKVVIFTVEEAISLHQGEYNNAPRSMLIHDLRWSAISMSQIEGRTHRDGKFSQIYWLYFNDTIEEDIAKIVLNRVISMKSMVGDDTATLKEIEELLSKKIKAM